MVLENSHNWTVFGAKFSGWVFSNALCELKWTTNKQINVDDIKKNPLQMS